MQFWDCAVENAANLLTGSPTSANAMRTSPIQVLSKQVPDLREIVDFGSLCTVYRDPRKNSQQQRVQVGTVVDRSDETIGFRVYIAWMSSRST